jgi:methyltransferase (TIGR00027 family)
MAEDAPVLTARIAAAMRASHLLVDGQPPIFRDDFALGLSDFNADEAVAMTSRHDDPAIGAVFRVSAVVRARFTEEEVELAVRRGIHQYVILGAGLDSFAWRRSDLSTALEIYEVDHPGTQAYKRERLESQGLAVPANLHFVAVDFTAGADLASALGEAGFDLCTTTAWSWLGVIVYLTREQIGETLHQLAHLSSSGSVLVADFILDQSLMDDVARAADDIGRPGAASLGEPYVSTFDTTEITALFELSGWGQCRTHVPFDLASWFANRSSSLSPSTFLGLISAELG